MDAHRFFGNTDQGSQFITNAKLWNLKRGGTKQFPFADGIRLTGVSDNHSPHGSRGNLALASQIDPSAIISGFPQNVGLIPQEIQQSQRGARGLRRPFLEGRH